MSKSIIEDPWVSTFVNTIIYHNGSSSMYFKIPEDVHCSLDKLGLVLRLTLVSWSSKGLYSSLSIPLEREDGDTTVRTLDPVEVNQKVYDAVVAFCNLNEKE